MIQQGDSVYIREAAVGLGGLPSTLGVVIGWRGLDTAVVQWGTPGDYQYADVPVQALKKYEVRSHK